MRSASAMVRRQWTPARSAPGVGQPPRPAAGREHQRVVRQHPRRHPAARAARARAMSRDAAAEVRLHLVLGEELRRTDEQPLALERAGQVLLRQRRALVRQPGLFADQRQLSREAPAAQRVDGLHGSLAGPGDHDLLVHWRKDSPGTVAVAAPARSRAAARALQVGADRRRSSAPRGEQPPGLAEIPRRGMKTAKSAPRRPARDRRRVRS